MRAPFDGVVRWVARQADSKDYEVLVQTSSRSPRWFDFDHLDTIYVDSGATVKAGQPIGVVRAFTVVDPTAPPNGATRAIGFVDLMIGDERTDLAYCPIDYVAPALKSQVAAQVTALVRDWRALGHERPDTTGMVAPGCRSHTAKP